MLFKVIICLALVSDCVNVNSHSGIYDAAGNLRQGLELVQSEWNILKMGNPKYIGQCKMVRFKTIYIESVDTGASIPLMTDGVINENMDTMVDYVSSKLTSYRSFSHDAILIYGFGMKRSDNGAVKAKMSIKDGLSEWGSWSSCSATCGNGIQTRTRTCAYDSGNFGQPLSEQKNCYIQECCNDIWTSWIGYDSCSDRGKGPFKQQRSRRRFVQVPACSQEGKSVQYDYDTHDCSYTGDWGKGVYCGQEFANMILNAANGCRRNEPRAGEGVYEEVREWSDGQPLFTGSEEPANSVYHEECCVDDGCSPTEVQSSDEC